MGPSGELDGTPTLSDGRDTTKIVKMNLLWSALEASEPCDLGMGLVTVLGFFFPFFLVVRSADTEGIPQDNIDDKGYWDSGCSRHMTINISYLSEYEPFNGGYVLFGDGRGKINGKGSIKTGKFDAKGDEGYFVGYSSSSKAFRVFNKRTKKIEENLHVEFLENRSIEKGTGPDWLFDIDTLTNFMNYVPVVDAGSSSTNISTAKKDDVIPDNNAPQKEQEEVNGDKEVPESSGNSNPTASIKVSTNDSFELASSSTVETEVLIVSTSVPTGSLFVPLVTSSVPRIILKGGLSFPKLLSLGNAMSFKNRSEDFFRDIIDAVSLNDVEANLSNMETAIKVSSTPTLRIHKDHPKSQIIGLVDTPVQTRQKTKNMDEQSFIAIIHQKTNLDLLQYCLFSCFLSQEEPNKIVDALKDPSWEEGIDYEEVFALVARIEAIRLFLDYASYMGFTIYQMDVNSAFLYGTINEEVYVMQPLSFQDHEFPHRVYKVEKAMYGLHQAPKAWYGTLSKYLLDNGFQRDIRSVKTPMDRENPWGKDGTSKDAELHLYRSMIGLLMYLTASRPNFMFAVCACARHQVTPKECHLHAVKRILDSDYGGSNQDRKSTTGGCQFLERRLISWQCKKQTIVATSITKAEYVAAASGCGQVLWIQNQLRDYGVKTLEDNEKRREGFSQKDAPNSRGMDQGEDLLVGATVKDSDKSADKRSDSTDDMANVLGTLGAANILASRGLRLIFTTASAVVSPAVATASRSFPTAAIFTTASVATPNTRVTRSSREVVIKSSSLIFINIPSISKKDKGKGKMTEPEQPSKEKVLEQMSAQLARDLEAKCNKMVAKYLSEYEQAKAGLSHDEKVELIDELLMYQRHLAQINKYQAQQNKPTTKTERRNFYMSILRSNAGWKVKDFKGMTFEHIEEKFIPTAKVLGTEPTQEQQSKEPTELSEEELKKMMELVPVEELYIEALQVKYPIIDWEIYSEG
uniref:Uncharacterized protein n=1 Tax=Tanacetum cinerariifolium TaxID=118510 RepID=A0A699GQR9_TANCI|nr:hypothetical protein [Tanacetum cinerariifolium]